MLRQLSRLAASSACTLLCATVLHAQAAGTATLLGNVTDPSGAAVAAAKVTVVNPENSFTTGTLTTTEGTYQAPYLAPGTYRLTVEAPGFKRYVREGLVVRTGEMPRLDVQLEVGAVSESVQVTGAAPLLDTETATAGQVLDGDLLVKIPLSQKRAIRILFYMPGANAIGGFTVLGQRSRAMGYTVDGVNGKEPGIGNTNGTDAQISTTQDAFEEVKLYTTGVPAELGHSSGGLMSIVFKSGTNQLHGSFEDRYINKAMIHRAYLDQLPRSNPFTYHETTALVSGPLRIPKIYNGHDRTFFLAGFERHFENSGTNSVRTTVPSEAMYNGDFSFGGQTSPAPLPIYNPFTTRQSGSTWVRDPFPGNIIPKNLFDPAAVNFLEPQSVHPGESGRHADGLGSQREPGAEHHQACPADAVGRQDRPPVHLVAPDLRPLLAGAPSGVEGRLPGAVRLARDRSQRAAGARGPDQHRILGHADPQPHREQRIPGGVQPARPARDRFHARPGMGANNSAFRMLPVGRSPISTSDSD